jgi:hypothetical protein
MNGALFGLFGMATLFNAAKSWHWHRWFELVALLTFVALQLTSSQAGLAQWCVLRGVRLGGWVPLIGGLAGAAVSAGILALGRVVAAGIQQQQAAAAAAQQQQAGAEGSGAPQQQEPLTALLSRAAALVLKRLV